MVIFFSAQYRVFAWRTDIISENIKERKYMQPINFTTAPTLVIETKRKLIDLLPQLVENNRLIQFRRFENLDEISAYTIRGSHSIIGNKVFVLNKETFELAFVPYVSPQAMTLGLNRENIDVLEELEEDSEWN